MTQRIPKGNNWTISTAFINEKKCLECLGNDFAKLYLAYKEPFQPESVTHRNHMNDRFLLMLATELCRINKFPTLSEIINSLKVGDLFFSIEKLAASEPEATGYWRGLARLKSRIIVKENQLQKQVYLEYDNKHITCSTGSLELTLSMFHAVLGRIYSIEEDVVVIHPLIIGPPEEGMSYAYHLPDVKSLFRLKKTNEFFAEDIDEFSTIKLANDPNPREWKIYMEKTSEQEIKSKFCLILNDIVKKDWGGEMNDHFSTSLHLKGDRKSSAFLFKGPAGGSGFSEMKIKHLGRNGNQISRLAKTPAKLLVIQHCYLVGEDVREMIEIFANNYGKEYCVIDGKDTFKILKAYNLL